MLNCREFSTEASHFSYFSSAKIKATTRGKMLSNTLHHLPRVQLTPQPKSANILIVDDDVDSAILLESIFRQYGCDTAYALNSAEAKKRICSGKADIIILDWMLGEKILADQVILQSIQTIEKFANLKNQLKNHKMKIISYSSLSETELKLPESIYFQHVDHWQKPIERSLLVHKTICLMNHFHF